MDIKARVPQGPVLGYTMDIPRTSDTNIGMFADDTAISTRNVNYKVAISSLQNAVTRVSQWAHD